MLVYITVKNRIFSANIWQHQIADGLSIPTYQISKNNVYQYFDWQLFVRGVYRNQKRSSSISIVIKCPVIQCGGRYRTFSPSKAKPGCIKVIKIWTTEEQLFQFIHWTATVCNESMYHQRQVRDIYFFMRQCCLQQFSYPSLEDDFPLEGFSLKDIAKNINRALIST